MPSKRSSYWTMYVWLVGTGALLWGVVATVVAPYAVRQAYQSQLPSFLNALIRGRDVHPVTFYLAAWRGAAVRISAVLAALAVIAALCIWKRRSIGQALRAFVRSLPDLKTRDIPMIAIAFGVIGGLAEACWVTFEYWALHRVTDDWVRGEIFWMAPMAASVTLLGVTILVMSLRRWIPLDGKFNGLLVFVLAGLCLYSLGRAFGSGIHPMALVALSAGLAAVIARGTAHHTASVLWWTRRGIAVATAGLGLWALWLLQSDKFATQPTTSISTRADAEQPNILLLVWDTVRARSLSLYGYDRTTTPHLDSLSQRSVVFDAAVATAPWTLPSHASLFTGRYHHELSVTRESPLDDTFVTLAEALRDRGYQTGAFIANTYWVSRGFGLHRGFQWYEDRPRISMDAVFEAWHISRVWRRRVMRLVGPPQTPLRITAEQINASLLHWIDTRVDGPFFAFLNLFDAHEPYRPPGTFGFKFSNKTPRYGWSYWRADDFSAPELQELRDAYDSCIYYLDHQLGQLLQGFRDRGLLDNTIVVVTADHGETLGEHQSDLLGHDNNIYYDVLNVPLVFYYPQRFPDGGRYSSRVSTVDVPVTIFDLVTATGSDNPFPGRSLVPALLGNGAALVGTTSPILSQGNPADYHLPLETWPMSKGPLYSLVDGTAHYIVNAQGDEQLFNLEADPWERDNQIGEAVGAVDAERLRTKMAQIMGTQAPKVTKH